MRTNSRKVQFLILGGGVAGLGAGIALKRSGIDDSLVLEKENQVGGLNRNVTVRGCDFGLGPKILLLDDSENSKDILSFLNGNYEKYPVVERTYLSQFGLLEFPLQRYLIDLPKDERKKVLNDLEKARKNQREVKNFKDWLINGFGVYFCKLVLFPYEEKKWQIPLDQMDYKWALDRPIKVDYKEILEGSKKRLPPNKFYYYPKKGNISVLTTAMAKEAGQIELNCHVNLINLEGKYVKTNKGRFYYDYLISSLPLDLVTEITEDLPFHLKQEAKLNFRRLSILVYNFVFDGSHKLDGTAIYYSENKFCFRRASILQNLCPALARGNLTPISVELSAKNTEKIDKNKKLKEILDSFSQIEGLNKLGKPIEWEVLEVGFAYPLQINGLSEKVKSFHDYYAKHQVYHCGRGGTFDYCNSDVAYRQGKEIAERILHNIAQ